MSSPIKLLLPAIACSSALFLYGCGSDDDSDKKYRGYMPKFAGDILTSGPARPLRHVLQVDRKDDTEVQQDGAQGQKKVATAEPAIRLLAEEDTQAEPIEFDAVDCSKASDVWNASPQAANFNNSALQFIQNLQAQTVFYDCIIRAQVFNHSAEVATAEAVSTVRTSFDDGDNSYFASWTLPANLVSEKSAKELQIDSVGILVNLQPGIDSTKTRVDLNQSATDSEFIKQIRSTLQDRLTNGTNIRSVTLTERKNSAGQLSEQRIAGRIIFDNNLSVVAALIKPGIGAVSYLKQCADNKIADDYLRACDANWQEQAYDSQWQLINDANALAQLKAQLQINGNQGTSVTAEQLFYNGESEDQFFRKRSLPAQSPL